MGWLSGQRTPSRAPNRGDWAVPGLPGGRASLASVTMAWGRWKNPGPCTGHAATLREGPAADGAGPRTGNNAYVMADRRGWFVESGHCRQGACVNGKRDWRNAAGLSGLPLASRRHARPRFRLARGRVSPPPPLIGPPWLTLRLPGRTALRRQRAGRHRFLPTALRFSNRSPATGSAHPQIQQPLREPFSLSPRAPALTLFFLSRAEPTPIECF